MKATAAKVVNPGEFEPPKEERECPICHRFTRHPYAKSQKDGKIIWLCRRECSEAWDTKELALPIREILENPAANSLQELPVG